MSKERSEHLTGRQAEKYARAFSKEDVAGQTDPPERHEIEDCMEIRAKEEELCREADKLAEK